MQLPGNNTITPTHEGILPLSENLSKHAQTATILLKLRSTSLLFMGKLCDDDNMVIFYKTSIKTIAHNHEIVDIIKT